VAAGTTADANILAVAGTSTGDLMEVCAFINGNNSGTDDFTITLTGGQSWAAHPKHIGYGGGPDEDRGSFKCWSATFNGTWASELHVSHSDVPTGNFAFTVTMKVAIPTSASNVWVVDVQEQAASYTTSGSCDVTRAGQTSLAASTITFTDFTAVDDVVFTLQTGGWTNPGAVTEWRNPYGSVDMAISSAYKIQTSAGATGSVVNRQTSSGCDDGWTRIVTYKEIASAPAPCLSAPPAGKQLGNCPSGYTSIATGSVIDTLNASISPDIAIGDIPICDLLTTPSSYPLTIGADGNFSYAASGDSARQYWNCTFYDVSVSGTHASDLDAYNNNLAPFATATEVKYYVPLNSPMTPVDLADPDNPLCGDGDLDALTYTSVDALPTGLSIVNNVLQGTATSRGQTVVTFRCTDVAGEATDFD